MFDDDGPFQTCGCCYCCFVNNDSCFIIIIMCACRDLCGNEQSPLLNVEYHVHRRFSLLLTASLLVGLFVCLFVVR
jgi:hypothetical protein